MIPKWCHHVPSEPSGDALEVPRIPQGATEVPRSFPTPNFVFFFVWAPFLIINPFYSARHNSGILLGMMLGITLEIMLGECQHNCNSAGNNAVTKAGNNDWNNDGKTAGHNAWEYCWIKCWEY